MQNLGKDVLSIILTHIPYELVEVISSPNPLLQSNINYVRNNDLFWKKRAELFFGKKLQPRQTDWKIVYKNLIRALTTPLPGVYKHDPILYCIWYFNIDQALNKKYIPDTVSILIEVGYDPSANNQVLMGAMYSADINILKLLLQHPRVDPSSDRNKAILYATANGRTEMVRLLLQDPRVDPSDNNNVTIATAAAKGYTEIVKLLLQDPRVDPSANNNIAIRAAFKSRNRETMNFLLQADVLDRGVLEDKKLSVYIREYIRDSLSGLLAMHFLYQNVNATHIYNDPEENIDNFISLYYQFLRYLIRTVPSMNRSISYLTSLISRKDLNSRIILLESVKNILYYEKNGFINNKENRFTNIFSGYFMLSFNPPYTYIEILTQLKYKNMDILYLTAKLIGAKIGLEKLIKNGLQLSPDINRKIKNALKINLVDILN